MANKKAAIILNGDTFTGNVQETFFICADGGYDVCRRMRKTPNVIIGDLDSIAKKCGYDIDIIKYPKEKDFTDGELCIKYCAENGIDEISIYGASGGRLDHILGNIGLLKRAANENINARIVTNEGVMYLMSGTMTLDAKINDIISIVPFSDSVHILYTEGLKYPTKGLVISKGESIGLSNVALDESVKIVLESGEALVFHSNEA